MTSFLTLGVYRHSQKECKRFPFLRSQFYHKEEIQSKPKYKKTVLNFL